MIKFISVPTLLELVGFKSWTQISFWLSLVEARIYSLGLVRFEIYFDFKIHFILLDSYDNTFITNMSYLDDIM